MATREPLPNGVSHSTTRTVGSSEPSANRSSGKAAASPPAAAAPARTLRLGLRVGLGLGLWLWLWLGVGVRLGGVPAALALDDGVDQVGLAHPAEAVEPELGGDHVQVGERTGLE